MSATLPNLAEIAAWMQASLYVTNYRPIQVQEHVLVGRDLYSHEGVKLKEVLSKRETSSKDYLNIFPLIRHLLRPISEGQQKDEEETPLGGTLVFCSSKF